MAVINAHWYNKNEGRAYPIDDGATCNDDTGIRLPSDLLVDCNLRWPSYLGQYAFLAGITVTSKLITLTIQAADSSGSTASFLPLAVVSVRKPIKTGRMVQVTPQVVGVGGWVVFGNGVNASNYSGRFATPEQSRFTTRTARPYKPLPVSSVQAMNVSDKLTGIVLLKVTPPLAIAKEERYVGGAYRDCIVVSLVDSVGAEGFPIPSAASDISGYKAKSVFQQYAGPCSGRPESNTCGCPNPIQNINSVAPDCDGTLTIEFQGCAQVAQIQDVCGIAVTCQFGLVDACLPQQLPTSEGLLPNDYTPTNVPIPPDIPVPPEPPGTSDSLVPDVHLPYVACFINGITDLEIANGDWIFSEDNSPTSVCAPEYKVFPASQSLSASTSVLPDGSYQSFNPATRCVAVFEVDVTTAHRKATTELKLTQGPTGARHNGQLVLNYQPHPTIPGQYTYFAAEVDYDTQEFRLLRFNGTSFQVVAPATVAAPGIQLDKWYRLSAIVLPVNPAGNVSITAQLVSVEDGGLLNIELVVDTAIYQPSSGKFGIGTNRAISKFAYLKIEEAL